MNHTTGIYKLTNTSNQKYYIGQSVHIERRWKEHKERAFCVTNHQYNSPLYRAIRKHGLDSFTLEILETCSTSELNSREQYWIALLKSNNPEYGYNLTAGGDTATHCVLTKNNVQEIKQLLKASTMTQQQIANQFGITQRTVSSINSGETWADSNTTYPIRVYSPRQNPPRQNLCARCGQPILPSSTLCHTCNVQRRREEQSRQHPAYNTRDELKALVRAHPISDVARLYHVSATAIRRWCKRERLPYSKRYIDSLDDTQWVSL